MFGYQVYLDNRRSVIEVLLYIEAHAIVTCLNRRQKSDGRTWKNQLPNFPIPSLSPYRYLFGVREKVNTFLLKWQICLEPIIFRLRTMWNLAQDLLYTEFKTTHEEFHKEAQPKIAQFLAWCNWVKLTILTLRFRQNAQYKLLKINKPDSQKQIDMTQIGKCQLSILQKQK